MSMASISPSTANTPVYVRKDMQEALPPPASTTGIQGWVREHLLSSPLNIALTLLGLALFLWIVPGILEFLIFKAVWTGVDRTACLAAPDGTLPGACWAFVQDRFQYFIYASYPVSERWRVNIFFVMAAIGVGWMLWVNAPRRDLGMLWMFVLTPFLTYGLLSGNNPLAFMLYPFYLVTGQSILGGIIGTLCFYALGFLIARMQALSVRQAAVAGLVAVIGVAVVGFLFALLWNALNLAIVTTDRWGGLMVTLIVAGVGIVVSLPVGVLLALGRRSKLPIVKFFSVAFIEFVRGVPLITVLFMANTMLPLFLPDNYSPDKLLRALVGIALFASAYMAEVVRAGLQALPKGQYEGAMAVGLGYWQMMRLIILPQALKVTIPNIVNNYIGLFKDTSLLLIVGIFDFLKAIETARIDPQWAAPTTSATGYAFAALVYFAFCYSMGRYARFMERRLSKGDHR